MHKVRAWFNGRTGASQASNTSSILVVRSFFILKYLILFYKIIVLSLIKCRLILQWYAKIIHTYKNKLFDNEILYMVGETC